ncbi:hypothetical protein [Brevundimonas sp. SL161]|uniref:hypothetical protein n=1 Tax=Brevundimonas sp. SL161 TaxID=2804613 RepID=UPI003CFB92AB
MKRYLFESCAYTGEAAVERLSHRISDEWLAAEVARDPNLDRIVDLPIEFVRDGVTYDQPAAG